MTTQCALTLVQQSAAPTTMPAALFALHSLTWVTKSQSKWGVGLDAIRAQMAGASTFIYDGNTGFLVESSAPRDARAELGFLWSYNPNTPWSDAGARGLGGGITWSWDDNLCDQLLGRFSEDIMYDQSYELRSLP